MENLDQVAENIDSQPPEERFEFDLNPAQNQTERATIPPEPSSVPSDPQSSDSSLIQPALSLKELDRGHGIQPQPVEPSNIELQREQTRSRLAIELVKLLSGTIITILVIHILNICLLSTKGKEKVNFEASKDVAGQILSPLVTLTATGIGFYFGSRSGKDQ